MIVGVTKLQLTSTRLHFSPSVLQFYSGHEPQCWECRMSGQEQGGRNVTLDQSMLPILTKVPSVYGPLQELVFVPRTPPTPPLASITT